MIIGISGYTDTGLDKEKYTIHRQALIFAGQNAGICYMGNDYVYTAMNDIEGCLKRSNFNAKSGHYSVFEHFHVTFLLEDISKAFAMFLNNFKFYCTSERSGRYTKMNGCSDLENEMYDKWLNKIKKLLIGYEVEEKAATKIAQENARYMLSIYTKSTTMSYTIPYNRLLLLLNYIETYCLPTSKQTNDIIHRNMGLLEKEIGEFYNTVRYLLGITVEDTYITSLEDHKKILQNDILFANKSCNPHVYHDEFSCKEHYGSTYSTHYVTSLVCFGQLQRHRRISYKIFPLAFSPAAGTYAKKFIGNDPAFYIPKMLRNTQLEDDMNTLLSNVEGGLLQGSLCLVYEKGLFEDFYNSKCKERLCSRAQLEIQDITIDTVKRFIKANAFHNMDYNEANMLSNLVKKSDSSEVQTRCSFMQCKEPCPLGRNGLKRKW